MQEYLHEPIINFQLGDAAAQAGNGSHLVLILSLMTALIISMVLIPMMVRIAPRLGMIDQPEPRKVHALPVPRVGGVGIVIGTLVPVVLLLPLDGSLLSYIFGALVLFLFGVLDDVWDLGHYAKFTGQFIAVIAVVYFGDVYVMRLPFMGGGVVSEMIGRPFTVFAMVGMINAINHSDGLDGLAGGESLLSLGCMTWLAFLADGESVMVMALAAIGGLIGFMRFNTHPARIFMGDGGSQFLGFTLGYLAVLLTQKVNPVLSPALPLLMLGLPVADILAVLAQRIYQRKNWFKATRNHIHHRLLDLGFRHHESVVIVYSIQSLMVLCAILMPYESDGLIIGVYLTVIVAVFVSLWCLERSGTLVHKEKGFSMLNKTLQSVKETSLLASLAFAVVIYGMSGFLITGALLATHVPPDLAIAGAALLVLLLLRLLTRYNLEFLSLRMLFYMAIVFVVYLLNTYQPGYMAGADPITYIFFAAMAAGIALSIRFTGAGSFTLTPMDYLILLMILVLAVLANSKVVDAGVTAIALKSIILFYGCELILARNRRRLNVFTFAVMCSLLIVTLRGIMINIL